MTNRFTIALVFVLCIVLFGAPAAAYTTELTVTKYDPYGAVIDTRTITWEEMRDTLPVYGDGVTHYYMHGPTFDDSSFDLLWDPIEEVNIDTRDYGAAMGTDVKDLCDLVGGAEPGDTLQIKAEDNFNKWFDYEDVYNPEPGQGNMVVTWYTADTADGDDGFVGDGDYSNGMRLIFFADTSTNPWGWNVHGNWDMHETLPASRWHYYYGGGFWPSTSGLSVKYVSNINIYQPNLISCDASGNPVDSFAPGETVYVKGMGLDADTSYTLWVQGEPVLLSPLDELERPIIGGTYVLNTANDPSGAQETVTTDASGDFAPVAVWTATETLGEYDIVADNQASGTVGTYDSHDEIDNPGWEGFEVAVPTVPPETDFSASVDAVANGAFETGDLSGWTGAGVTVDAAAACTGSYGAHLDSFEGSDSYIEQQVDFTDAESLTYEYYIPSLNNGILYVYLDGSPIRTYESTTVGWVSDTISGYTGTHTISFTAWTNTKNNHAITAYIDAVTAAYDASGGVSGDVPLTVYFMDTSSGSPISWEWDFDNDGTVDSTEQNPTHMYTADGLYTVSLTATNVFGSDTETKTGFATAGSVSVPVAAFSADPLSGEAPLTVQFTEASTNETAWEWDFENDGTVDSTEQNPVHEYTTAGTYTVNLTVTNAYGSDTETKTDYITVYGMLPVRNLNTGAGYLTIQEAVDDATAGDVIEVGDGSYTENVLVDKVLTIRSENGTAAVTVTAASPALPVFDVDADGVTIEGFTVRGPTDTHVAGIEIVGYDSCLVTANDCAGCYNGIHIGGDGTSNTVTDNYCHENTQRGISIRDTAYGNYITGNTVENNADAGICIKDTAHDNVLWLNDVIDNGVEILTENTAHSPEALTYSYQGGIHTGYLGNYYYDYSGTDTDGDGVGTPSYSYGTYGDDYPLVAPCSNYAETVLFVWGPYLTGTTTTATVVNVKTPEAATVTVEYADDAYYTANGGYEHSATGEAGAELHHIDLAGLSPGTLYHYRVVRGGAETGDLHFWTLPESGTFSFVAYGDSQDQLPQFSQDERHKLVADRIAGEEDVAFLLHSGDLVNDATLTTDWDRFFSAGGAMLANVTIFPALGNHEQNATLYYDIFGMPEYYSFDAGNAHFTLLDSNDGAWLDMDEQTAWLEADLATPADWNFVTFHHPPYTSEESHWGGYANIREEWEDIFIANGVDVVTNGEVHAYERYLENGITYMVLGIGGGPSYLIAEEKIEGYQNSLENTLGYAKVTIDPQAGTATVEIKPVAEIAADGSGVAYIYPEGSVYETFVLELPTGPTTWYVDDDGGADFTTIQAAVDAAKAGDTVVVKDGHYVENVEISKKITLQSENGATSTIIETAVPMSVDSVIEVTADYVNITGFTMTQADVGGSGIYLIDADYCTITDTVSETNGWGIRLANSTHNVIRNTANIDCYRGIALYEGSNENLIDGNEVSWNADYGIWLEESHANTIVRNNASGAEGGGAFNLRASNDNIISENVLDCYDPEGPHGLTLEWGSTNNRIYLNNFKNTILPANGDATGNIWVSPDPVDYSCGSAAFSSLLGNYWDLYAGTDLDGNGIGDTPYIVPDGLGTDSYPLMGEWQDGEIMYSAPPAPTVDFSANVTSGDAPLTVQFTDQSFGEDMVAWAWDFDSDGTVDSTEQSPAWTYSTPGTYSVSLTVTNAGGNSDDEVKTDYITVNVPPVPPTAAFTADVTEGDAPLSVQFTDESTGDAPLTYAWDFDNDGTVDSAEQSPAWTYSTPGTYTVSLTVTNVAGSDDEVKEDYITVNVPPVPPTAAFTADVTEGDAPLTVQFTDQSTGDTPLSWSWDFDNDGTVDSTDQNPSFTYDTPGIYTVSLTVTNIAGSDDEVKTDYITVNVPPVPPTADFTADVTEGDAPLEVQFTDLSTGDAPLSWSWDFENDGVVDSIEQNPLFTYSTPGIYTVSLTVTNVAGSDDEVKVDYITVNVPPVPPTAEFTADVTEGDAPLTVQFTDASTGDAPLTYGWDFNNDGVIDSTDQNPAWTYDTPGDYTVSLTVTNIAGSDDEVKANYITVNVPPVPPTAAFTADVIEGDAPLTVQFTDQSTGDAPLTYGWDFNNDGTVDSTDQNPSFTYDTPGIYTVSLTVTNIVGSDDEVKIDYITVNVPPVPPTAAFTADVTEGDAPLTVQFTDASTGDTPLSWSWDFENDGVVDSIEQSPSFTYSTPGIYTVSLTVTNIAGSDDEVKIDYITVNVPPVPPTAAFTADVTEGDAPLEVQFTDLSTGDAPLSWSWDFENDGVVDSIEQNPLFTYDTPGAYTVSLTVTNIAGSDDEVKTDYITVNVPPVPPTADFTADVTEGDAPLTVQFTDASTGDAPLSWSWDFNNDGTVDSTDQNPSFTYDTPGIYTVSLTVTNVAGSDDEVKVDYITVNVPPVPPTADFTADVTEGDAPLTVQFTDESTGDAPLTYAWDFENDGTVDSTEQSPSFTYDTPGAYTVSLTVTNIAGSDDEVKIDYITVNVPPVPPTAAFTADVTEGDAPLTVQFTDASTGDTPLTYAWDFDNDGTVDSTDQNPSLTYETPGTYTVSLTVTNIAGSDDEIKTDYITVNVPPVPPTAAFTADVTEGDAPLEVQFTDLSTGDAPLSWSWDFENDGVVDSIEQNPLFTYSTPGIYTVSLTVTNIAGSDDEVKIDYITVNVPPVPPTAAFTADVTEGDAPLEVQFTDASTGDAPLTYAWDFENDGTVDSTEQNPAWTYSTPGTYTVSLTVTNVAGSDDEVKVDYITVNVPPVPPTAAFTADVTEGDAPLEVQFTDASTGDAPLSWSWDFDNDGTVDSTDQNPSFTYETPGTYTVSLTVTNVAGSDDEVKTDYITVNVPPVPPTAAFTADVTEGDAPLEVQFTDASTGDAPLTYAWDFENDGTVDSTDQNPLFTYDTPGIYTVSLTVANIAGSDDEVKTDYITVNVPPVPPTADFTADVTEGDAPLEVQFTDQSTGDTPLTYAWDFENDGTVDSTDQNPLFTYETPGTYTVSLTVTNVAGSDDEVKADYITVNVPPVPPTAAFTADVTEGDAPLSVQFTDLSTGDAPLTYAWDFDNGGTVDSTEQSPSFTYDTPGTYTVSLTVTNVAGSDDEVKVDYITVNVPPVPPTAAFTADVTDGDAPLSVQFTDASTGDAPLTYAWDFENDGIVDSTEQSPAWTYDTPGIYTVSLTVTNIAGSDDEVKMDYITVNVPPVPPTAAFTADVTEGDAPLTVQFTDASTGDAPLSWSWDFNNDGTVDSTDQNPLFTYETPGIYTVSLTVTNIAGSDDEVKIDYITVNVPPVPPTAAFTADVTDGDAPLSVQFTDASTGDAPLTYAWDFENDGTVDSTEQSPSFTYDTPGTYTVSLTVTNIAGSDDEVKTDYITVNVPPVPPNAAFTADVTEGDAPLEVQFTDASAGDTPLTYAWDFENDGTVDSTEQSPAWTYDSPGTYTVSLTVTNIAGSDSEVKTDYITVSEPTDPLTAAFTANVTSGYAPLTVQFTDASNGDGINMWAWDFDDDGVIDSTEQNPICTYDTVGTYTVKLTVTGSCGCDDEVKEAYICVNDGPSPVPEFPSLALPAAMMVGMAGIVFGLRRRGVQGREVPEQK